MGCEYEKLIEHNILVNLYGFNITNAIIKKLKSRNILPNCKKSEIKKEWIILSLKVLTELKKWIYI